MNKEKIQKVIDQLKRFESIMINERPFDDIPEVYEVLSIMQKELDKPLHEPVCYISNKDFDKLNSGYSMATFCSKSSIADCVVPLYAEPPILPDQKSLSDQEVMDAIKHISFNEMTAFNIARALEDYRVKKQ